MTLTRDSQDVGWKGVDRNGCSGAYGDEVGNAVDDTLPIVFGVKPLQMPYASDHIKSEAIPSSL